MVRTRYTGTQFFDIEVHNSTESKGVYTKKNEYSWNEFALDSGELILGLYGNTFDNFNNYLFDFGLIIGQIN